jgi:hypothetical protein
MWTYKLNTLEELKKLSLESLKGLSPSEKFDILMGRYEYPLTHVERKRTDPNDQIWEGTCNGWATAALKFSEPPPVTITNKDGIVVPFASSDIKSLLMLHQFFIEKYKSYAILGDRCENVQSPRMESFFPAMLGEDSLDACSDSNAGAFHLVLTNMIGRLKKGLVFDVDRDSEVWNQPVVGYEIEYKNLSTGEIYETFKDAVISLKDFKTDRFAKHRSKKAVELVGISMRVGYVNETGASRAESDSEAEDAIVWTVYDYDLEIDAAGNIIGGEWLSQNHPDFIWIPSTDAVPRSPWDHLMANLQWEKDLKVSAELSNLVRIAAENGKVLHPLVQKLVEWSQP